MLGCNVSVHDSRSMAVVKSAEQFPHQFSNGLIGKALIFAFVLT